MQIEIQGVRVGIDALNFLRGWSLSKRRNNQRRKQKKFCQFHRARIITGAIHTLQIILLAVAL